MSCGHNHQAAARRDADLVITDLGRVCGLLEEVATLWRRAGFCGHQSSPCSPGNLQDAAGRLAEEVRALPEAKCEERPVLAFSVMTQLAGLEVDAAFAAAVTGGGRQADAGMCAAIAEELHQARQDLWNLICNLARTGEPSLAEDVTADQDTPVMGGRQAQTESPAAGPGEAQRALAMQRTAIDALPEADLRRLLRLIGGLDPEALHRAAAAFTETFCTVAKMKPSVAALQPVARAVPCTDLQDVEP
jgi:hypothetical protein